MTAFAHDVLSASQNQSSGQLHIKPLFGLNFADFNATTSADWIASRPAAMPFGYVVTPNTDHVVRLSRNPALMPLYHHALLCLMDSRVIARTAAMFGLNPARVTTGSELTARILAEHITPGERVTIIGVSDDNIAELMRRTGIVQPAHYNPPMGFDKSPAEMALAVKFVIEHPARFVFLAVGSPRQEQLAGAIAATGQATGTGLCIGASLDFLAGASPRAPDFIQKAGLEWLHRLISNPRRLGRRYLLENPVIFRLLWKERQLSRRLYSSGNMNLTENARSR